MNVLVTGATGFIGSHLIRRLLREGCSIHALARNPQKIKNLSIEGIHWIAGDLSLLRDETLQLPPMDVVIHLAGIVHEHRPGEYHQINIRSVADLLQMLERQSWKPRRLLFASSLAAVGPTLPHLPLTEESPAAPNEPYGVSKLAAEQILKRADFPVTVFRPGAVIGPGDPEFLTLFKMARRGWGFGIAGLNPHFSFISVDDLVEAMWKMMQDLRQTHHTYFVSHDEVASVQLLWQTLQKVMDRKIRVVRIPRAVVWMIMKVMSVAARVLPIKNQIDRREYIQMTTPAYLGSGAKLQQDLGWRAQHDLERTLRIAHQGYLRDGWL